MAKLSVILEKAELAEDLKEAGADEALIVRSDLSFHAAASFSEEETEKMIQTVHQDGMEAGVIADRLFSEGEIEEAGRKLQCLLEYADTVQIADPGLVRFAAGNTGKLIFRPAALITNAADAAWWMRQGFGSVYVSPLLTYEETEAIVRSVKGLSLCIHGRQLMSVSARKLLHAYETVIGKSVPKTAVLREEKREGLMPVFENTYGTTVWTDYVLHSFRLLPQVRGDIVRCEINSLLTEDEQLLDTVRLYRALLDGGMPDTDAYLEKYRDLPLEEGYYTQKTIR
ncbi:MAG: U32 family peptidase [Solobacterium sp.]|nr:U32 family peptidase [Solobacterium sp.]